MLTILPAQFVIGSKIADCTLGNLRKFNSEAPEFVVEVDGVSNVTSGREANFLVSNSLLFVFVQGALVFPGKFEIPSTKFLSILCQPSSSKKTGQSSLTDVFERVLVFGKVCC